MKFLIAAAALVAGVSAKPGTIRKIDKAQGAFRQFPFICFLRFAVVQIQSGSEKIPSCLGLDAMLLWDGGAFQVHSTNT